MCHSDFTDLLLAVGASTYVTEHPVRQIADYWLIKGFMTYYIWIKDNILVNVITSRKYFHPLRLRLCRP